MNYNLRSLSGCMFHMLVGAVLVTGFATPGNAQGTFESRATGAWNTSAPWLLLSGTDADGIPDANDNATIKNGHTITIGNGNRNCANLTVDAGGILSVDNSGNIRINADPGSATVNGTVTLSSSGNFLETGAGTRSLTLGSGGKITVSGSAAFPAFDTYALNANSTMEFMANGNQNVQSGIVYGNVTIGGTGKKTVAPLPSDTAFTCNGKLSINSGVTFDVSTNVLYANFNGDVEINGTLDASVGIVVVAMHGALWTNNGTHLCSVTPGLGQQPSTTFYNTQIGGTTTTQKFFDVVFNGNTSALAGIDSARNIEIKPGATFNGGPANTHKLRGNWLNNGTFTCSSSTVSLIGTASQTVSGSTFDNLVINNPAGVSLTGNTTIAASGSVTLTSGNITTGNYTLSINNPNPGALVLGSNRIIGNVTRAIATGSTGTYNFLTSNSFVTPNGVNNPSDVTMMEFPGVNPPNLAPSADTNKIVKRYYSITQNGAGAGFAFTLRLPYLQTEVRGNEASYVFFRYGGTGWVNMGSTIADVTNNYVQQSGMTGFSNWAIAEDNTTLPIQLAHFSANVVQGGVRLTWGTLTETNNYGFFIQRSPDNENSYADLPNSFVPGQGTTIEPHEYSWTDVHVAQGTYYYRLKQIDLDGSVHFNDGVQVIVSAPTSTKESAPTVFRLSPNYPNPFNPSTTIDFTVEQRQYTTLMVYNMLGQVIATLFAGTASPGQHYQVKFEPTDLTNGIYVARLESGTRSQLQKMILLK